MNAGTTASSSVAQRWRRIQGGSVEGRTTALQAWPVPSEEGGEQSADVTW